MSTQVIGSVSVIALTLVLSVIFWDAIKATMGLRVSRDEELEGLDLGEHGMEAYAGFQLTTTDCVSMTAAASVAEPAGAFAKAPQRPQPSKQRADGCTVRPLLLGNVDVSI